MSDPRNKQSFDPSQHMLTEQETVERLGLKHRENAKSSLAWLRRSGQLGYVKVGRGIYAYPEEAVRQFLVKRYHGPLEYPEYN